MKSLWNLLKSPAVLAAILVVSATMPATANPLSIESESTTAEVSDRSSASPISQNNQNLNRNNSLAQVTSVSQLSDVQPTDWAFQALQSLVERYGCIAGYPEGTYRGNRALTRYEFAAGLNACLNRVNELIATATASGINKEDLATLQRLQEEFAAELVTLRGRVDALEATTAELEANQFSTTTTLSGEVVAAIAGIIDGERVPAIGEVATDDDLDDSTVFVDRVRLEFNTSFKGEDLLYIRLATGNFAGFSTTTGTTEGELAFVQDEGNDLGLEVLLYNFPLTEQTEVILGFAGTALDDIADTLNFLDGDGALGALSAFGTRNPIYYLGDGAGLGVRHQFSDRLQLSLGYLAGEAASPDEGNGLFNGAYSAIAQLVVEPIERLNVGLTYIKSYDVDNTGVGSNRATFDRFDDVFFDEIGIAAASVPTSSNSYGVEVSWRLSDRFVLGGWVGYTNTSLLSTASGFFERGDLEIWNYAVTLAFPDLGKEGNLLGFVVGMEPKVTDSTVSSTNPNIDVSEDEDTSLHIEGFYQYQVTDNIAITPGVIWITAPGFNENNSDLVIGTLRTTFTF